MRAEVARTGAVNDVPDLGATRRLAGRFSLAGLYDGPAVLAAQKPGYRWGYAVARPGEPEPKVVLRTLTDPPAGVLTVDELIQAAKGNNSYVITLPFLPKLPAGPVLYEGSVVQ